MNTHETYSSTKATENNTQRTNTHRKEDRPKNKTKNNRKEDHRKHKKENE
jgi:hypothetical protein